MQKFYVRVRDEQAERIAALVSELSAAANGVEVTHSDVLRLLVTRGLEALEAERGAKRGRR